VGDLDSVMRDIEEAMRWPERPEDERFNLARAELRHHAANWSGALATLEPEVRALARLATHVETTLSRDYPSFLTPYLDRAWTAIFRSNP
jgi:hypothetical protein